MRIYTNYNDEILELNEVSFSITTYEELILLKSFIKQCINDIKEDDFFEHKHFSDYLEENKTHDDNCIDIIIYKEKD